MIKGVLGIYQNYFIYKNHFTCRGALNIPIDHAGFHTGFSHNGLHLQDNVIETILGRCGYLDGLLHFLYLCCSLLEIQFCEVQPWSFPMLVFQAAMANIILALPLKNFGSMRENGS